MILTISPGLMDRLDPTPYLLVQAGGGALMMNKNEQALVISGERMKAAFTRWQTWLADGAHSTKNPTPVLTKAVQDWERLVAEIRASGSLSDGVALHIVPHRESETAGAEDS